MLHYAGTQIPYYRNYWETRRRNGDRAAMDVLENWPVLHKEALRSYGHAFLPENANRKSLVLDHTSGTTGVPLRLWMSREAVIAWYALFEARWRTWYGISRHDRWGILGGQLVIPFARMRPPFWVFNAGMNQLYLSTFHISPDFAPSYIQAIRDHKLVYLLGYASSLYDLARFALEQKLAMPRLKVVLSNAEPLYHYQRETISQAFACSVIDTYGQAENVCAASECSAGRMHLWPEVGITEILDLTSDQPAPLGEIGRLVCTGLLNTAMPLIRYEVGDCAHFPVSETSCTCGRTLPVVGGIEGRTEDMIVTRDGRRIEGPDTVFQADWPIREVQIVQESLDLIRVCVIPAPGFDAKTADLLVSGLQDRVGNMEIRVEQVIEIPRNQAGKRKVIVSKVDKNIHL
jgi:phenylacetate-CoA ligase